jgi:hypothetical protein
MNKIIFIFFALMLALNVVSTAQSSSFQNNLIRGVKSLDDIEEIEWYRVEGKNLLIGWKGVPKYLQHTNCRAGILGSIATGHELHIWAVRHTHEKMAYRK